MTAKKTTARVSRGLAIGMSMKNPIVPQMDVLILFDDGPRALFSVPIDSMNKPIDKERVRRLVKMGLDLAIEALNMTTEDVDTAKILNDEQLSKITEAMNRGPMDALLDSLERSLGLTKREPPKDLGEALDRAFGKPMSSEELERRIERMFEGRKWGDSPTGRLSEEDAARMRGPNAGKPTTGRQILQDILGDDYTEG